MFITESKDGVIFGLESNNPFDHLTLIYDPIKKQLRPHITQKIEKTKTFKTLPSMEVESFLEECLAILNLSFRKYHHKEKAWKMTQKFEESIFYTAKSEGRKSIYEYFLQLTLADLPDFKEGENWTKVRIRDELGKNNPLYIQTSWTVWQIFPIDEKMVFQLNLARFEVFIDHIFESYGLNYLMENIS